MGIKLERVAGDGSVPGHIIAATAGENTTYLFWCPGCECPHPFSVPRWVWNGSMTSPTFSPSLLCNQNDPETRCHLFLKDGMIQFLGDCHHKLAGQTVECPDWAWDPPK